MHRYCSAACYQARYRVDHPEKFNAWDAAKKAAYHRRRARKRGVSAERIVAVEVFERDGWLCGICDKPVDSNCEWPDPQSPSLDHIVPLAKGGPHSLANVQLAHLSCNIAKGDRVADAA